MAYLPHPNGVHGRPDVVHAVADRESLSLEADGSSIRSRRTRRVNVHIHRLRARFVVQVEKLSANTFRHRGSYKRSKNVPTADGSRQILRSWAFISLKEGQAPRVSLCQQPTPTKPAPSSYALVEIHQHGTIEYLKREMTTGGDDMGSGKRRQYEGN